MLRMVMCSYFQICDHRQPLVHCITPGHAVKMSTAVCKCPFGLELVIIDRLQGKQIACSTGLINSQGSSGSICIWKWQQGEKCKPSVGCHVLGGACSYLTLSQNESHSENILSCLYLQRLGRYRRLPIGLVAKHSPKITNYVNDSEDKST